MKSKQFDLKTRVYGRVSAGTPGKIWGAGDFADFGPPAAIGKALQRLATTGKLRRVSFGLYDRPKRNRLTDRAAPPDYRAAIDAVMRHSRVRVLIDGMTAANDLGLSDAVPGRVIVHSDARLRPIRLDNLTITFRPTAAKKLYWAGRPAMRIVQALHWLKPKLDDPQEGPIVRRRIERLLSDARQGAALRKDLTDGMQSLPSWMQTYLRNLMPDGPPATARSQRGGRTTTRKRSTGA